MKQALSINSENESVYFFLKKMNVPNTIKNLLPASMLSMLHSIQFAYYSSVKYNLIQQQFFELLIHYKPEVSSKRAILERELFTLSAYQKLPLHTLQAQYPSFYDLITMTAEELGELTSFQSLRQQLQEPDFESILALKTACLELELSQLDDFWNSIASNNSLQSQPHSFYLKSTFLPKHLNLLSTHSCLSKQLDTNQTQFPSSSYKAAQNKLKEQLHHLKSQPMPKSSIEIKANFHP